MFLFCRAQFELIEPLLRTMVYIRSDSSITTTLDATPTYIHAKIWPKYIQFQTEYKERLGVLRKEKREVPSEEGADKNMPAILKAWTGKFSTAQPTKNFKSDHSCAFDDKRITEYERRNAAFQDDIKKPGHLAAAKMIQGSSVSRLQSQCT